MPQPALSILRPGRLIAAWLLAALVAPSSPASESAAKDYSIFVGQDVSIVRKGKQLPVTGARKKALEVMLDGKLTIIPLSEARDLRIDRGVKLSPLSATLTNVRGVAGTSRLQGTAEMEAISHSLGMQEMTEDLRDKAMGDARTLAIMSQSSDGSASNSEAANNAYSGFIDQLPSFQKSVDTSAQIGSDLAARHAGAGGLDDTGYIVSFEAATPVALERCHVAVISEYTLPGNTGLVLSTASLEPIGELGPVPRRISCEVRGFPAGAELKGYRVALYSEGQEIATNLSSRRTEVTRDEAVMFLVVDYIAKHPNETRPPAPILMVPRSAFVAQVGSAPLDQVIYARVGKDGRIIRLSTDAAGVSMLPSTLSPAIDKIAFVPALEKGKPVEGVAKLKLADLVASN